MGKSREFASISRAYSILTKAIDDLLESKAIEWAEPDLAQRVRDAQQMCNAEFAAAASHRWRVTHLNTGASLGIVEAATAKDALDQALAQLRARAVLSGEPDFPSVDVTPL